MLHTENRKVCEKGIVALIVLLAGLLVTGCQGTKSTHHDITMEAFSDMKTPDFVFNLDVILQQLRHQLLSLIVVFATLDIGPCLSNLLFLGFQPLCWCDDRYQKAAKQYLTYPIFHEYLFTIYINEGAKVQNIF